MSNTTFTEHRTNLLNNPDRYIKDKNRAIDRFAENVYTNNYNNCGNNKKKIISLLIKIGNLLFESQGNKPLYDYKSDLPKTWNGPTYFNLNYIKYEIGHLISKEQGGTYKPENLSFQSARCNNHIQSSLNYNETTEYKFYEEIKTRLDNIFKLHQSKEWKDILKEIDIIVKSSKDAKIDENNLIDENNIKSTKPTKSTKSTKSTKTNIPNIEPNIEENHIAINDIKYLTKQEIDKLDKKELLKSSIIKCKINDDDIKNKNYMSILKHIYDKLEKQNIIDNTILINKEGNINTKDFNYIKKHNLSVKSPCVFSKFQEIINMVNINKWNMEIQIKLNNEKIINIKY